MLSTEPVLRKSETNTAFDGAVRMSTEGHDFDALIYASTRKSIWHDSCTLVEFNGFEKYRDTEVDY